MAGTMHEASAAPVDPTDLDLAVAHEATLHRDIAWRTAPADGDNGRMLANEQGDLPVVAVAALQQQPLLEVQRPKEVDLAQQEGFQGRRLRFDWGRTWRHQLWELEFAGRKRYKGILC